MTRLLHINTLLYIYILTFYDIKNNRIIIIIIIKKVK